MADSQAAKTPPSRRQVAAIVAGNALEFYDFLTYAFFAIQIGHTFFPSSGKLDTSLLPALATFGAGFVARPFGAFFIGRFADRAGRKPAMLASFAMMGLGVVGLALTPGYAQIGVAAPVIVIALRLVQGFALGGEVGPSTAFMIESAPPDRRGLYVSLQYMGQDGAIFVAGVIGVILSSTLSAQALTDIGWRIAFLVGASIVPFGLILRRGLVETLHHDEPAPPANLPGQPLGNTFAAIAVLGFAMLASGTCVGYTMDYLTTYSVDTLKMVAPNAFAATVMVGLVGLVFDPVGGWLSDHFGRKPVMVIAWTALLVLVGPCFWAIAHYRTIGVLLGATALMQTCASIGSSSVLISITESLPKRMRAGAVSLIYAGAISIFGGSVQFMEKWLTGVTHNTLAPAWYMGVGVAVGLIAMGFLKETAPIRAWRAAAAPAPA